MSDSPESPKRHWHGTPGDRYQQTNVWMNGGSKAPASRAAWALTPEMMANAASRRDSAGSTSSASSGTANQSADSPQTPSVNERRRSSGSSGSGAGLFSNLRTQKRESSDPSMAARRASWTDQQQKGGVFSKLWDGYTRGSK
ncbi:uncharacterized protein N7482_001177 [Penicillium canariense]|uniref:Uncharacterized protein n=1 Tax=Penicillium canariense TaxID=189055 RepID=A0A9W9IG29_9EURO|nr:uncharacterized protein N7482_001177 [Penicillium canariense]KAJ5175300.1 hypothetical protein N7482_001177 [Penicillium canariense]